MALTNAPSRPAFALHSLQGRTRSHIWIFAALLVAVLIGGRAQAQPTGICAGPITGDGKSIDLSLHGFPELGKWMIDGSGSPAHWLGEIYQGRAIREPINLVLVDAVSTNADAATRRVVEASARAGYPIRMGHSSGYRASIGGQLYGQLPAGWDEAFSNHRFEGVNNHGRIFGPVQHGRTYLFVGAFSREQVSLLHWPGHRYASFNKARDEFALRMDQETDFKIVGHISMQNAINDEPSVTTGDHDGRAVLLCAWQ